MIKKWNKDKNENKGFEEFRSVRIYSNINGKENRYGYDYRRKPDGTEEYKEIGKIPEDFGKDFIERMTNFDKLFETHFSFDPFKALKEMAETFPSLTGFDARARLMLEGDTDTETSHSTDSNINYDFQYNKDTKTLIGVFEVPGYERKDIKLGYRNGALHIKGDNQRRTFDVMVPLEYNIDPNSIKATLRNGILEVTMKVIDKDTDEREIPIS